MPKSKSRSKKSRQRYELRPARRQKTKKSPRWYGFVVLGVMAAGVVVIVVNYMGIMPGTNGSASGLVLGLGLGLIGLGFVGTTFWT
jgi:small-conductance mechanosensitive channel